MGSVHDKWLVLSHLLLFHIGPYRWLQNEIHYFQNLFRVMNWFLLRLCRIYQEFIRVLWVCNTYTKIHRPEATHYRLYKYFVDESKP